MNPTQFTDLVNGIDNKTQLLDAASSKMRNLVARVKRQINRTDPLSLPLTQEEVDHIATVQGPLYASTKTEILDIYNSLP